MSDQGGSGCALFLVWLALLLGLAIGGRECGRKWKAELIKRNLAEYDSVTGEWRWKEGE